MDGVLIVCRSVTYAQRTERALRAQSIPSSVVRLPKSVDNAGCGYAVLVNRESLANSLNIINKNGLRAERILYQNIDTGSYENYGKSF